MPQDVFAYAAKSVVDLGVGIAQDVQPERMQICVSFTVCFDALRLKMLRSVQLDHESGRMNRTRDDAPLLSCRVEVYARFSKEQDC